MVELGHVALRVRELERAIDFYKQAVGLKIVGRIGGGRAALLTGGRQHHELLSNRRIINCIRILLPLFAVVTGLTSAEPPRTVDSVDLNRYMGRWYEIAALPNFFQRHCVRGTTADYSLRGDGTVAVTNRCETKDGEIDEARGVARPTDSAATAKLEVSFVNVFGKQLFWGDYWIIGLGDDYDYALVGTPSRRWGWILAREPRPSPQRIESWLERLRGQGYDPKAFVLSDQSPRATEDAGR